MEGGVFKVYCGSLGHTLSQIEHLAQNQCLGVFSEGRYCDFLSKLSLFSTALFRNTQVLVNVVYFDHLRWYGYHFALRLIVDHCTMLRLTLLLLMYVPDG